MLTRTTWPTGSKRTIKKKQEEAVFAARQNLKNFAFRQGLRRCVTVSAWGKVRRLDEIWGGPTRLTKAGYKNMAEAVIAAAVSLQNKRKAESTSGEPKKKQSGPAQHTGNIHGAAPLLVEVTRAEAMEEAEADIEDAVVIWAADAAATLTSTRQEAALGRAAARPGVLEDVEATAARVAGPPEAATYQAATNFIFIFRSFGLVSSTFKFASFYF
jgi:hypothetical protein